MQRGAHSKTGECQPYFYKEVYTAVKQGLQIVGRAQILKINAGSKFNSEPTSNEMDLTHTHDPTNDPQLKGTKDFAQLGKKRQQKNEEVAREWRMGSKDNKVTASYA